jgi:ABC-type sugar transport system substrate-binding protein
VSSRYKAIAVLATAAVLIAGCSSKKKASAGASSTPATVTSSAAAPAPATSSSAAPAPAPASSSAPAAAGPIKVTLITKATGGFWDAMIAGAKKFATDNPGVIDLTTLACKTNDDTPCQIAQIQDSVTKGSKAIVIANMGPGVMPALNAAKAAGVKIILVDNNLPGFEPDAISATDNVKGGIEAGDYIKTQLKSGDTIGLLEAVRGVPALDARIDGVKKELAGTGINVVIGGAETKCDTATGASVTQDLITKYPKLTAIYSACDSPAEGVASSDIVKNHPLKIFGYDGDPEMAKLIAAGKANATMAQSPMKMTNLGIQAAVNAILGKPFEKSIDTGVTLWDKSNASQFTSSWQ